MQERIGKSCVLGFGVPGADGQGGKFMTVIALL